MARTIQSRPVLRSTVQQFNATRADEMIGAKIQVVKDGTAPASGDVTCDPEANVYVSLEDTTAPIFRGLDLSDEAVGLVERTFVRPSGVTQQVRIELADPIDGNTAYTLDAGGSSITLIPITTDSGSPVQGWLVKNAIGTVTAVP